MSIINDALKDLQARSSRFTPIEVASVSGLSKVQTTQVWPARLLALVAFAVLFAVAWRVWDDQAQLPVATVAVASPAPLPLVKAAIDQPVSKVVPMALPGPPRNTINGLQFRESKSDLSLEFSLHEKVVSYLKERGEDRFVYHLKDINSQIVAPVLHGNRWIRQLSIAVIDDGVDIDFNTAPDILVETRQQQLAGGGAIWVIRLKNPSPTIISVSDWMKSAAVKTPDPAVVTAEQVPVKTTEAAIEPPPVKVEIKSTDPDAKLVDQLQYALKLLRSNRRDDAQSLLIDLLDSNKDFSAREQLLAVYKRYQQPVKFSKLVLESMARYPEKPVFRTEYGRSLFKSGHYDAVIDLLLDPAPVNGAQQGLVAASYQRLGHHQNAIKYYQRALAKNERNPLNWIGLGISQENTSALSDALHSYQRAAKLGRVNSRLRKFVEQRTRKLQSVIN